MHLTNENFPPLLVVLFYCRRDTQPIWADEKSGSQIRSFRFSGLIVRGLRTNLFALRRLPFGILR